MRSSHVIELLQILAARFHDHRSRHPDVAWQAVLARLENQPECLAALQKMEHTGGEPDVVGGPGMDGAFHFYDCAPESPQGRRSLCYDEQALQARKEAKPAGSAHGMAKAMGATLLDEAQYLALQQVGSFDTKTSSWLDTPEPLRRLGGALFADRRYGRVFVYHNGAQSYYAGRGFRTLLTV